MIDLDTELQALTKSFVRELVVVVKIATLEAVASAIAETEPAARQPDESSPPPVPESTTDGSAED